MPPEEDPYLFTPLLRKRRVSRLDDPEIALTRQLESLWRNHELEGKSIAITVGSRGISERVKLVKAIVSVLKKKKANPFLLNAMGSHGGGTSQGQREVLKKLGYRESSIGCPVRCSMEVAEIESGGGSGPVVDQLALEADGVVVFNRVKPHTSFHGKHESGLVKMLVVGLGKAEGAKRIHRLGPSGLRDTMGEWGEEILKKINVIGAVGVIENSLDQVMEIGVGLGTQLMDLDSDLLEKARPQLPGLPVDNLDVLIVDQMGKDISGTGMDTNVIGRLLIHGQDEPSQPNIGRITVHDLTEASGGNATGVGLADVIGPRLFQKINREVTQKNVMTTGFIQRAKIPFSVESDAQALEVALSSLHGLAAPPSILRIQDTLHPDHFWASGPVVTLLKEWDDIQVLGESKSIFDSEGELQPFLHAR